MLRTLRPVYQFSRIPSYFTVEPWEVCGKYPYKAQNLVSGVWRDASHYQTIIDPLNGEAFLQVPDTQDNREIQEVIDNMKSTPISGLHNPLKNPQRYQQYGDLMFKIACEMRKPEVHAFFTRLVQRVAPKSEAQAAGEVIVTRRFFENFGGDQPRFLFRSFNVAGDHNGQQSTGYRWPYGAVGLITPFNFPIEIPGLQLFGALLAGNRVFFKGDSRTNVVMEQFLRMALHLGLPANDVDMIFANARTTEKILVEGQLRNVLFTGSSKVGEHLTQVLHGKIKYRHHIHQSLEDAGFDWKILGPDVPGKQDVNYVVWQCDQDAYACSGQKCSAQSILFVHENWLAEGIYDKLKSAASKRQLSDLTIGPILTWNNTQIKQHINNILQIPGSRVLFGGNELTNHSIPSIYGAFQPTAIYVPLDQILNNKYFELVTTEVFGPFQIVTEYSDISKVLQVINQLKHHLTAGVVSNDINFIRNVAANTVNGVTYTGLRARTTGAPQNHWFGPCGDPRGAGIGTPEAILKVWSSHREIILDHCPINQDWKGQQS